MENPKLDEFERLKRTANQKFDAYRDKNPKVYKEIDRTIFCLAYIDGYLQRDYELLNQLKQK